MVKKFIIGANWKCNGNKTLVDDILDRLNNAQINENIIRLIICPPFMHLLNVKNKTKCEIASQHFSFYGNGAYTGEISLEMLKSNGINTTILGHSERRNYFCETDENIYTKLEKAIDLDFNVILCIGEKESDFIAGQTEIIIKNQLYLIKKMFNLDKYKNKKDKLIIAYEPVWAIGTGKTPNSKSIQKIHRFIKNFMEYDFDVIYGGSVNIDNCLEFSSENDINGFLIGSASLKPQFTTIIKKIEQQKIC